MLTDDQVRIAPPPAAPAWLEVEGRRYPRRGAVDRVAKRAFDLVVGALGMLAALPLFAVIAVLIKLDSKGPVFYRQTRVGRHRRPFRMWKFRKMFDDLPSQGPSLTLRYDFRMTRVGRILERTKLDELPQLLNVLSGEMSVIGPRPEVPKFVEHYPERWNEVLGVKPGIFGANQIRNRNESELYPPGVADVEGFYVSHILPDKLEIDARYARRAGLVEDVTLLVRCLVAATFGTVTWRGVQAMRQQLVNLGVLALAGAGSMATALALAGREASAADAARALLLAALIKPVAVALFRIHRSLAVSFTAEDVRRLTGCALASAALVMAAMLASGAGAVGGLVYLIDALVFLAALVTFKLAWHAAYMIDRVHTTRKRWRRLVVSAACVAPLTLAAAIALQSPDVLAGGAWNPLLLLLPLVIRPLALLLTPAPPRREHPGRDFLSLEIGLLMATLGGSAALALAGAAFRPVPEVLEIVLADALLFQLALTALAVAGRHVAPAARHESASGPTPRRLLVAGTGVELASYVGALAALPDQRFEVVGLVTPHGSQRTGTIGGHPILGEVLELPQILKTLRVQQVVVVPNGVPRAGLAFMQKAAAEAGCAYLAVPMLSGILARRDGASRLGRAGRNGASHAGAGPNGAARNGNGLNGVGRAGGGLNGAAVHKNGNGNGNGPAHAGPGLQAAPPRGPRPVKPATRPASKGPGL